MNDPQVTLYVDVSLDGFIARSDDSVPWGDEAWEAYDQFVSGCDVCIVGRRTFEMMKDDEFDKNVEYLIASRNGSTETKRFSSIHLNSDTKFLEGKKVGILGGREIYGTAMKLGLVDKVIMTVDSLFIGEGISLFDQELDVKLNPTKEVPLTKTVIQYHFEVVK